MQDQSNNRSQLSMWGKLARSKRTRKVTLRARLKTRRRSKTVTYLSSRWDLTYKSRKSWISATSSTTFKCWMSITRMLWLASHKIKRSSMAIKSNCRWRSMIRCTTRRDSRLGMISLTTRSRLSWRNAVVRMTLISLSIFLTSKGDTMSNHRMPCSTTKRCLTKSKK